MSLILVNQTASPVMIVELGRVVEASGQADISDVPQDVLVACGAADEIITKISGGTLLISNGVTTFSQANSTAAITNIKTAAASVTPAPDGGYIRKWEELHGKAHHFSIPDEWHKSHCHRPPKRIH